LGIALYANGNTATDAQGRTYTWDFENRLTQVVNPGVGTTTFKYDPWGRRIQKSGPLGTTNFLYDGRKLIEELDSGGNVLARYTGTENLDEPLSQLRSGIASYYQQDGLGSVTSLSNTTATLVNTYSYDAFGKSSASSGTLANPFQYTGRELDSETGLYYYRARYFDPTTGRFLSEDPLGFDADTDFYPYVGNSPTTLKDPTGKAAGVALAPIAAGGATLTYTEMGGSMAGPIGGLVGLNVGLLLNDASDIYDLGVAYGWWGAGKNPKNAKCDDCSALLADIARMMAIVNSRYAALMSDPLNLFNTAYNAPNPSMPDAGTWLGHVDALADAQRGLQNRINLAKARGCPVPPQAEFLAELPLPTKPGWK
jgi:RHS repeat-associated protein